MAIAAPPAVRPCELQPYPPIEDYGLISDCESLALVSRHGSIDWCCMPRLDADSCFGRLLDWRRGGHCSLAPLAPQTTARSRAYEDGTMVLTTRFETPSGRVRLHDFFVMRGSPGGHDERDHLARLAVCEAGSVALRVEVAPRFDCGAILPALRRAGERLFLACGSNQGLLIDCSVPLALDEEAGGLSAELCLHAGEQLQLSLLFAPPEALPEVARRWCATPADLAHELTRTVAWWSDWERGAARDPHPDALTRRSALVLKALCFERTGAIAAAATTSLPEAPGGERNWDYRFSWVRDSVLAVRALHRLGFEREAERFRWFVERSAAGNAHQLQLMYGVDGRRRLTEVTLDHLEGWRGARPVRVGNAAAGQRQLDVYGSLLELAWIGHQDAPVDPEHWAFLVHTVEVTCERWGEPDHGIWEMRTAPRHFVHSKVMCWVAVDRAIRLAQRHGLPAPLAHWCAMRETMRAAIDQHGYDRSNGVYVQAWGHPHPDASLLLLAPFGYVAHGDPRMRRTTDWVWRCLSRDGLLLRYDQPDGLRSREGAFLPCTFWLAECLAHQGRLDDAWRCYERAATCANELGLFSEAFDCHGNGMLGNFPQALTHLSQIRARLALDEPGR